MIHQCLHGYQNGHELLASSLTLTREQRTLLSQITDLSGPAPVEGFDGYISAFPIPGGLHVLAKTWYAFELPRPGCVWTHSLLLNAEVTEWSDLRTLQHLWRRPSLNEGFDSYAETISTVADRNSFPGVPVGMLETLIEVTYADVGFRVCVLAESSQAVQSAFFALWNQQWPELRRTFTFTTGMLGTGARVFDLQAIPAKNRRLFQERLGFKVVTAGPQSTALDEWAKTAAADASRTAKGHAILKGFLWEFGRHFHQGRRVFRPLCQVFQQLTNRQSLTRAADIHAAILEHFHDSTESTPLKKAIFGGEPNPWAIPELDALEVIARDSSGLLEEPDASFRERLEQLPLTELEHLVLRIKTADPSRRVGAAFGTYFARYDREHSGRVEGMPSTLLDTSSFNETVAYGLLQSGALRLLYAMQHASGRSWIRAAHRFSEESEISPDVEEFVLGQLWNHREDLRDHLLSASFGKFLKLAAAVLDVSRREAEAFPLDQVVELDALPSLRDGGAELRACAFLTMVGLVRNDPAAAYFMREGFSTVYLAAREQRLPWELWKSLESQLPWHFLEWDRCATLIEGSVRRFVDRAWTADQFSRTFRSDEEFSRAVSALETMRSDTAERLRAAVSATREG